MHWIKWRKPTGNHQHFSDEQIQAKVYEFWKARGYVGSSKEEDRQKALELLKAETSPLSRKNAIASFGNKDDREFALKVTQFQWERLKTIISALGLGATAIAAIGLFITYRQGEERLVTERFAKAVEQLGHQDTSVRIGAIYALERIANDSSKDRGAVLEILTAYVRERSQLREEADSKKNSKLGQSLSETKLPTDVQSALTVVANQDKANLGRKVLDLSNSNLSNADFKGARLFGIQFMQTNLNNAIFSCIINSATKECFEKVDLKHAGLHNASLKGAYILGVDLSNAKLENTDLKSTHIEVTNLDGADFKGADLDGATLIDTNLRRAKNLTDKQLKFSLLCKVQLPEGSKLDPNRNCKKLGIDPSKKRSRLPH